MSDARPSETGPAPDTAPASDSATTPTATGSGDGGGGGGDATATKTADKSKPQFIATGRLGVQIVLGLALVVLLIEAVLIVAVALSIPADGPQPGDDPHGLPGIDDIGGTGSPEPRGEVVGSPDSVPASTPRDDAGPLTATVGEVIRIADDRLQVGLDLSCRSGCRLESTRLEVRPRTPGVVIEAVEFRGPPGSWHVLEGTATATAGVAIHLDYRRGVWISSIGGWAMDLTLRIPRDTDATNLPLHVGFGSVRPVGLAAEAANLTVPIPPVQ